jgi:ketosteroid isomerase-like protein
LDGRARARRVELGDEPVTEVVRRAYMAFVKRDRPALLELFDQSIEFRPVDGLGLVGDTVRGLDAACEWLERRDGEGIEITVWLRTLEQFSSDQVLCVGVVSERGRAGRGYAATVAWICTVHDGRVQAIVGYPSEAAARRALSALR